MQYMKLQRLTALKQCAAAKARKVPDLPMDIPDVHSQMGWLPRDVATLITFVAFRLHLVNLSGVSLQSLTGRKPTVAHRTPEVPDVAMNNFDVKVQCTLVRESLVTLCTLQILDLQVDSVDVSLHNARRRCDVATLTTHVLFRALFLRRCRAELL